MYDLKGSDVESPEPAAFIWDKHDVVLSGINEAWRWMAHPGGGISLLLMDRIT